ncbi:FecR family protein [Bacteroides sp. 51]|uniref:FecR family protein n=1 Tax=Bacteroides sp. 51 TaxID=2302938 RepID=UPI00351B9722
MEATRPLLEKRIAARRRTRLLRMVSAAAAVVVLCVLGWNTYLYMAPADMIIVSTLAETKVVQLPDGTEVTLNRYTSLTYPDRFKDRNRQVSLTGEAYFAVTKDKNHPFIVQTGAVDVRVLGTEFNVEAYPRDEQIRTTLFEGSVAIDTPGDNSLVLVPGELAVYNKASKLLSKSAAPKTNDEIAWRDGALIFSHISLKEISRQLSNAFNVEIVIEDQQLEEHRLTGRFIHGETLDTILSLLQDAGKFEIKRENPTLYILSNPKEPNV